MTLKIQNLKDTHRSSLIKVIGTGAETLTKIVTAQNLFGALNTDHTFLANGGSALPYYGLTFYRVWYDIASTGGGKVTLYWKNADNPIITMCLSGLYNAEGNWSTITVPAGIQNTANGSDVFITAEDVTGYTLIFEIVKDHTHYDSGEVRNPEAFNFGRYGVTP